MRLAIAASVALVVAFAAAWMLGGFDQPLTTAGRQPPPDALSSGPQPVGGPFTLTDHTGRRVTDEDFRGRFMLVYFGFTFCPDVCPTELYTNAQALKRLGPAGREIVPVFITIDPGRDDPAQMARYVSLFADNMVGLTGSEDEIAQVAAEYRAFYARVPGDDDEHYLMDHSAQTYLMGPDGHNLTIFPYGISADQMAPVLADYLRAAGHDVPPLDTPPTEG